MSDEVRRGRTDGRLWLLFLLAVGGPIVVGGVLTTLTGNGWPESIGSGLGIACGTPILRELLRRERERRGT